MCAFSHLWTFILGFWGNCLPIPPAKPTLTLITYHEVIQTTKVISAFYLLKYHKTFCL